MDAAPTPILVVDGDGLVGFVNLAALAEFGYSHEQLVGRPVELLLPPDRREEHVARRAGFLAHPSHRSVGLGRDLSARREDGSVFPAEVTLVPVQWYGRRLVVATIMDITGRLRDEALMNDLSAAYLTLARMNQAIVRAPDELSLFARTCEIAVDQGGYEGAWVGKQGDGHDVVCVASAGMLDEFIEQLDASTDPGEARGRGPTGRVMRGGTSYFGQQYVDDPATRPWRELGEGFGIRATATLPLRCAGRVVATLSLYSVRADAFTDDVRALLEGVADNISLALDGFDTMSRLKDAARQRTELSQRLVAAQEAERARIAADVHDDSVQALAALDLRLGLLKRQVLAGSPKALANLDELHETVSAVSADLRDLLFQLEAPGPGVNLLDMLEEAAGHVFEDSAIRCSVVPELDGWDHRRVLSPTDRGQALRIVKEALFNARKHSGATRVDVMVRPGDTGVTVEIRDDGTGFDAHAGGSLPGHRGLANMYDRAEVSGGWCSLESDASGTTVRLWMPYDAEATWVPDALA